jgi:peptidoglycan hydrolase-like protein with peptidoglycan-binding domain
MEIPNCLRFASAYETPLTIEPTSTSNRLARFEKRDSRTSSSYLRVHFLWLAIVLSVLLNASQARAALRQGDRGPQVRALQQQLRIRGYFNLPPNGNFGSQTREALIRFQRDRQLSPDGILGTQTEAALFGRRRVRYRTFSPASRRVYSSRRYSPTRPFIPTTGEIRPPEYSAGPSEYNDSTQDFPPAPTEYSRARSYRPYPDYIRSRSYDFNNRYVLYPGSRGPEVERLQRKLRDKGFYYGPIDGIYGRGTERAVSDYQISKGLRPDGVAGPETLQALGIDRGSERRYVVVVPIRSEDTLDRVLQYQPRAFEDNSRLGRYVNAGDYSERLRAEIESKKLRSYGLDARVVYR